MITISLCMIVNNEEELLSRCLDSVHDLVDEIVIVDTGSTDQTKEIAAQYTNKIYDFEWSNDFSAARNFSFSKATKDFQFWLNANDILLGADRAKFEKLKETISDDIDIVLMKESLITDENENEINSVFRERLLKRINNYTWKGNSNESIKLDGNYFMSDILIFNEEKCKRESLDFIVNRFEEQLANGENLSPNSLFNCACLLKNNGQIAKAISMFNQFLLTKKGHIWENISACLNMGILYRQLGSPEDALKVLLHSFTYDLPTAEICCEIASLYIENKELQKAIFWYEMIFTLKVPENYTIANTADCWNFIPAIELCVCYYGLGDQQKAIYYNDLAASFKPEHPSIKSNRDFFANRQNKTAYYLTEMLKMRNSSLV